jgi:hypothetical protein
MTWYLSSGNKLSYPNLSDTPLAKRRGLSETYASISWQGIGILLLQNTGVYFVNITRFMPKTGRLGSRPLLHILSGSNCFNLQVDERYDEHEDTLNQIVSLCRTYQLFKALFSSSALWCALN